MVEFVVATSESKSSDASAADRIATGAARPKSVGSRSTTRWGAVFCGGDSWQQGQMPVAHDFAGSAAWQQLFFAASGEECSVAGDLRQHVAPFAEPQQLATELGTANPVATSATKIIRTIGRIVASIMKLIQRTNQNLTEYQSRGPAGAMPSS